MDGSKIELEKSKFNAILSAITEGVILLDPQQKVTYANDKACQMTGYKVSEMLSKHASKILNIIESNDKVLDINRLCPPGQIDMEGSIYKTQSVTLITKTDEVRLVSIESIKIKEGSKIDLGAMVVLHDVFEADELERMKTDFVSMAVHMLRTPLTVIKGFLNDLLKIDTVKKLSQSEMEDLSSAVAGASELDMLIENLLHLSEIQSGKFKIHTSSVSYEGLVASVVNEFKPSVQTKGLQLLFVPPLYEFPQLKLDLARIKEVLRNLIGNSVKFTKVGGIEVSIFKEDKFVHTVVKDTGAGIPQANLDYIFTKFYRVKDPLEMAKGLGLGLFVSKQIVETHKGKLWAESIEGQGSIFHFTLPL